MFPLASTGGSIVAEELVHPPATAATAGVAAVALTASFNATAAVKRQRLTLRQEAEVAVALKVAQQVAEIVAMALVAAQVPAVKAHPLAAKQLAAVGEETVAHAASILVQAVPHTHPLVERQVA